MEVWEGSGVFSRAPGTAGGVGRGPLKSERGQESPTEVQDRSGGPHGGPGEVERTNQKSGRGREGPP